MQFNCRREGGEGREEKRRGRRRREGEKGGEEKERKRKRERIKKKYYDFPNFTGAVFLQLLETCILEREKNGWAIETGAGRRSQETG